MAAVIRRTFRVAVIFLAVLSALETLEGAGELLHWWDLL